MYSYHSFMESVILSKDFEMLQVYLKKLQCSDKTSVCVCLARHSLQLRALRVRAPTNHAVNGAKEHGALGGRGTLAQVLQHQRAVAEDVDKLAQVEDSHLLQVLPLLVGGGRTDGEVVVREEEEGEERRQAD